MAEIKLPIMSYKEIGEEGARYALDECEYNGLTLRQWADKITSGEFAPVVHGHWVKWYELTPVDKNNRRKKLGVFCSRCTLHSDNSFDYCPNCGAKMDEEVNDI